MYMKNDIIAVIKYEMDLLKQRDVNRATLPMLARLLISLRRLANQL